MELYIRGKLAIKGQTVTTFRGEDLILVGWREPHKPSSSGHVYVKENIEDKSYCEYYPSVVGGEFK